MSEETDRTEEVPPKRKSRKPLIGLVMAIVLCGALFAFQPVRNWLCKVTDNQVCIFVPFRILDDGTKVTPSGVRYEGWKLIE